MKDGGEILEDLMHDGVGYKICWNFVFGAFSLFLQIEGHIQHLLEMLLHPPSISNYYNVDHTLLKVNVVIDRLKIYCVPLVQVLGIY